ncbi:MAG: ATP-binding protein [Leptospiraceae bacterium]|nr:ATP-binding protein [Leptospiraceae bacterium]
MRHNPIRLQGPIRICFGSGETESRINMGMLAETKVLDFDAASIWEQAGRELSRELPDLFFQHFISPLLCDIDPDKAVFSLIAGDRKQCAHIEIKYGKRIRAVVESFLPEGYSVCLTSEAPPKANVGGENMIRRHGSAPVKARTVGLSEHREAMDGAASAQIRNGSVHPFIHDERTEKRIHQLQQMEWSGIHYIYGPSGCGKTHLARTLSQAQSVRMLGMEEFLVSFATASGNGKLLEWKKDLHSAELVIIDDLQFLRSKAVRTAEQLRSLMDAALMGRLRLVLIADQAPSLMDGGADLRSRLLEARPLELAYLEQSHRKQLLEILAAQNGLELSESYLQLLSLRISGDHRKLQNAVHRLSIHPGLPDDPGWVEAELADLMQEDTGVAVQTVVQQVCQFYNVHPDLLRSDARDRGVVRARHLCAFFLSKLSGLKLTEIAEVLGRKDHSAVLYGIRKTEERFHQDLFLRGQVQNLEKQIRSL